MRWRRTAREWHRYSLLPTFGTFLLKTQSFLHVFALIIQINADSGIRLRYDELLLRSIRIAQNLRARGYQKGQIFGYSARNSHHVAPIIFAAWYLGCTVNAIDDSFGPKEFTYMMKTTQPVLVFCDVHLCDMVKQCLDDLENTAKIFTIGGQTGRSEPVESLLAENGDETDFVWVKIHFWGANSLSNPQ